MSAVSDRSRERKALVDDSDTAPKKVRKGAPHGVPAIRSEVGVGHKTKCLPERLAAFLDERKQRASQVSARVKQLRGSGGNAATRQQINMRV